MTPQCHTCKKNVNEYTPKAEKDKQDDNKWYIVSICKQCTNQPKGSTNELPDNGLG